MATVYSRDTGWIEKGEHVTARDENRHVTARDLPPAPPTIEQRIYNYVWESSGGVSRREIARALGLSSTGWLNGKIDGLVSAGYLRRVEYFYRHNMPSFRYEVIR